MMVTSTRERIFGGVGAAAIVGLIGAGLVFGLDVSMQRTAERTLALLDLHPPPAPPVEHPRPRPHHAGAVKPAAPANLKSRATPVTAPPILRQLPPPLVAAVQPDLGALAANGAADRPGPGSGAGGIGDGRGGGGRGGEGAGDAPPRQIAGRLSRADLPEALRAAGWQGGVTVDFLVRTDGRVSGCRVTASSGHPDLDAIVCPLIEKRFRYRPAHDADGRPVQTAIVGERSRWTMLREGEVDDEAD